MRIYLILVFETSFFFQNSVTESCRLLWDEHRPLAIIYTIMHLEKELFWWSMHHLGRRRCTMSLRILESISKAYVKSNDLWLICNSCCGGIDSTFQFLYSLIYWFFKFHTPETSNFKKTSSRTLQLSGHKILSAFQSFYDISSLIQKVDNTIQSWLIICQIWKIQNTTKITFCRKLVMFSSRIRWGS